MLYIKENKGITITALVIMIIVIMLLAGITITQGSDLIKNTKVETYLTNMITIRSKAKVYAEETNAEVWDAEDKTSKREEIYSEKYKLTTIVLNFEINNSSDFSGNGNNTSKSFEKKYTFVLAKII